MPFRAKSLDNATFLGYDLDRENPHHTEGVTMKYTPLSFEVNLRPEGFVVDIGSLYSSLMQLHDKRDARGLRCTLVTVLVYIILAKLSGENFVRGMADWVNLRKEQRAEGLGLAKAQSPHATTRIKNLFVPAPTGSTVMG